VSAEFRSAASTARCLASDRLSNLVSLTMRHVALNITQQELEQALAQCRSSLTHLVLSRVALAAGDEDWKGVGGVLLTMPALATVELQMAYNTETPLSY